MDDVIILDHTVELYIPTQCMCGGKLPEDLRDAVARDVKRQFNAWFDACSVQRGVQGNWTLSDGTLAEEDIDIVYSKCDRETLESIADEVCDKVLALPQVGEATVDIVFDPPWDRSMMSEAALLTLGL